ncbi:hypothetical protein [Desulfosporosinus sp. HMP52]|uniref:hypothetical protein n=1 Tax=Desulfosporosinus sp. HMP52 TaxID=1487923 RepID=UPI000A40E256|nr:hypothetical protein [Desulfosporosinus sp. HMP52]
MDSTQGVMQAVSCGMGISFLSKAATAPYVQMGLVKTIEVDHQFFLRWFNC